MASTLRTLANSNVCKHQQSKLEEWYKTYNINSCDNNLNVCCELLKTNAKIQGQLLTILNETARESAPDDSGTSIQSQTLPQWGSSFTNSSTMTDDTFFPLQGSQEKDTTLSLYSMDGNDLFKLDPKASSTHVDRSSMELSSGSFSGSFSPLRLSTLSSSGILTSSILPDSSRRNLLISRFIFLFANHRLDVQNLFRNIFDDFEMVQRIIFIATVESFHAAKVAFIHLKLHIKQYLKPTYFDPQSLEIAVIDYINNHMDCYDVQSSVNEVIGLMNLNEKISYAHKVDFTLISTFSREVCNTAFAMQALKEPLDIAFAIEGEPFDENKYRRTYDSDFTAPLIYYHVWPALMENSTVIVKGEAVTKKRALWNSKTHKRTSVSRSRSPSLHKRIRSSSR